MNTKAEKRFDFLKKKINVNLLQEIKTAKNIPLIAEDPTCFKDDGTNEYLLVFVLSTTKFWLYSFTQSKGFGVHPLIDQHSDWGGAAAVCMACPTMV